MSYFFNGEEFATLADFQRNYPAYRTYTDLIKAGVSTVTDMEKAIRERKENWRKSAKRQAQINNANYSFSTKRRKSK